MSEVKTSDLRDLRAELLREEIRRTRAAADVAELQLGEMRDKDRDRQVRTGRTRILPILDVIMPDTAAAYIDALMHWERRDPGLPIKILISSPGGSVSDGLAIFDTIERLRRQGHKVTTHGMGLVASMAAVLLQAGDERVLDKRAKLLIHKGSQTFSGNTRVSDSELEDQRFYRDLLMEDMRDILTSRSNLSRDELESKWNRRDWFLNAAEALELGLVDRVE